MARSYYRIAEHRPTTMTVAALLEALEKFDPSLPVVFRSPPSGAYGANHAYSLDAADVELMEREEHTTPGGSYIDDETGERVTYEASTQVFDAWVGVVLS
jgi:hypothetical protein